MYRPLNQLMIQGQNNMFLLRGNPVIRFIFMACMLVLTPVTQAALKNQLANHASPYLAMHGKDPVQWQEWNAATVAKAKKQGKLLFVSSGYFSCHWCHVMQRESYQNKNIARLLNKYFIPVKIDREINAALDARLIDFVENTQGYSGWPLNVFITPDGYPLVGMVYVPPDNFQKVLDNLNQQWQQNRNDLIALAKSASAELNQVSMATHTRIEAGMAREIENKLIAHAFTMADEMQGGFGEQNKFPSAPQLQALLDNYRQSKNKRLKNFLQVTLNQMAAQGLRDQLGGGFYRYSVDPNWQIPHFEKMLYDNALLAELYLDASKILNIPAYATIGLETLDFILRELATAHASFAASLSAIDNKNIEGGYYLWDEDELKTILTKQELRIVKLFWQLEGPADIEHGHHLVQVMDIKSAARQLKISDKQFTTSMESARNKMLQARSKRVLPKDHKRIAAWNGLVLSALVRATEITNERRYKIAAEKLKHELIQVFWQKNQLYRTTDQPGGLEDYAYVGRGLYDWVRFSQTKSDWHILDQILVQAWQRFYTKSGWIRAENMLLKYGSGESVIAEGPMPSPSATLINITLARIKHGPVTDRPMEKYRQHALLALNSEQRKLLEEPFWYATHINTLARFGAWLQ